MIHIKGYFKENNNILATKEDIMRLENKINDTFKLTMATIIAVGGLIVALIKLL
jgi:hypothetical protein